MNPQIATDPEQSRRLTACGVDPATADMVWLNRGKQEPYLTFNVGCNRAIPAVGDIPAWSLSTLLEMLPNCIMAENRKQFTLRICKCKDAYVVDYEDIHTSLYQSNGATAIEAVVRMIETLKFHKHELKS